jgi:hypothetical protein
LSDPGIASGRTAETGNTGQGPEKWFGGNGNGNRKPETGNRDIFAMKFMYKYGYTNIVGLNFGMRGWIKPGYPAGINE